MRYFLVVSLLFPTLFVSAQMSSENFRIDGANAGLPQVPNASSSNYQASNESGAVYTLSDTEENEEGGGGGGISSGSYTGNGDEEDTEGAEEDDAQTSNEELQPSPEYFDDQADAYRYSDEGGGASTESRDGNSDEKTILERFEKIIEPVTRPVTNFFKPDDSSVVQKGNTSTGELPLRFIAVTSILLFLILALVGYRVLRKILN